MTLQFSSALILPSNFKPAFFMHRHFCQADQSSRIGTFNISIGKSKRNLFYKNYHVLILSCYSVKTLLEILSIAC